jgi:hypothetical protein
MVVAVNDGKVSIGDAVIVPNISRASNGVMHFSDTVLTS